MTPNRKYTVTKARTTIQIPNLKHEILAKARGLSFRTGAQTMLYLSHIQNNEFEAKSVAVQLFKRHLFHIIKSTLQGLIIQVPKSSKRFVSAF